MQQTTIYPEFRRGEATVGGRSVVVVTGGSAGDVLTQQEDGTYSPVTPTAGGGSTGITADHAQFAALVGGKQTYQTGLGIASNNNIICGGGRLAFWPVTFAKSGTLDRIGIKIQAANTATTVRLGLYADDDGKPGDLVFDAGTVSATSSGHKEIVSSQSVEPGMLYWFAALPDGDLNCQSGDVRLGVFGWDPTLTTMRLTGVGYTQSFGALPATTGAVTWQGYGCPMPFLRVS